jgi:hypothetical protein
MGRNRKKHKKKEKIINYNVKETVPVVNEIDAPIDTKSIVKKSVNWSNMKVMTTGRGRRGPIYV